MRELKNVLDEYHQEITGDFLKLTGSIDWSNKILDPITKDNNIIKENNKIEIRPKYLENKMVTNSDSIKEKIWNNLDNPKYNTVVQNTQLTDQKYTGEVYNNKSYNS